METFKKPLIIIVSILLLVLILNFLAVKVNADTDKISSISNEKISASFFVLKKDKSHLRASGDSRFYNRVSGKGLIAEGEKYNDNTEKVEDLIVKTPDLNKISIEEDEEIIWFRSKEVAPDIWWIYGEIVEKTYSDNGESSEINSTPEPSVPEESSTPEPSVPEESSTTEPSVPEESSTPELELPSTSLPSMGTEFEKGSVEEMIYNAITTGDFSVKNVSQYNLKSAEFFKIWDSIRSNQAIIAYKTHLNLTYIETKEKGIIQSFFLVNSDSGFLDRYKKVLKNVEIMQSRIDERMTDLEKTLIFHDYIAGITTYRTQSYYDKIASGPLSIGYGDCMGYSAALELMLHLNNIEYRHVSSAEMKHGWTFVKLDNEWYHIDLTWDDTRTPSGEFSHMFFISNDYEFKNSKITRNKHSSWGTEYTKYPKSTSSLYETWFIHDVIGQMYYFDGEWYYSYQGDIVKSDIDGNNRVILEEGNGKKLVISNFNNGEYTVSNN